LDFTEVDNWTSLYTISNDKAGLNSAKREQSRIKIQPHEEAEEEEDQYLKPALGQPWV